MKRIQYIAIALILCLTVINPNPTAELPVEDFTHAVLGEEFTATWCVYCPSAAENLMKIYEDIPDEPYYHDKFFFVALITDVNDKAEEYGLDITQHAESLSKSTTPEQISEMIKASN